MKNEVHAEISRENGSTANEKQNTLIKKKVLNSLEYARIGDFIHNFRGLAIDCELEMEKRFLDVDRLTLKCILQAELTTKIRSSHWRYESKAKKVLKIFGDQVNTCSNDFLLKIAIAENMSPVMLCRALLQEKFRLENKTQLSRLMKYPHLIEDRKLSANVTQCLCSDNQDGPMTDLRRRLIGEEYEIKLKEMAKNAGMHYYDENDLRRMGYDKTPDIKMILPFLYKNQVVNWIESKANFGDPKSHKWNLQQQLNSYCNRFGPGIIIYWFGYHEDTPHITENNVGVIVLDDFPKSEHIVPWDFSNEDSNTPNSDSHSNGSIQIAC